MAIETAYFTGTTGAANYAEVLAWLQVNATDYFDEITGAENVITCTIGGANALVLDFTGSGATKELCVYLKNRVKIDVMQYWDSSRRLTKAQKLDNGIFIYANKANNIFITKTNDDNVMFAFLNSNNDVCWCIADFEKSSAFTSSSTLPQSYIFDEDWGIFSAGKTALAPAVTDAGTYSDSLFFVPFTQFIGQSGITIDVDGTKYIYNGVFALKE